jgi:hypothetical protein
VAGPSKLRPPFANPFRTLPPREEAPPPEEASPEGAKAYSLGREPQERANQRTPAPKGRQQTGAAASPLSGPHIILVDKARDRWRPFRAS